MARAHLLVVVVGTRIKFWHNLCCGDCTLKEAFLKLYSIHCNKESSIVEVMHLANQMLHWDILFSRAIQDWELELCLSFWTSFILLPLKGE